jgi:hypothetical protein
VVRSSNRRGRPLENRLLFTFWLLFSAIYFLQGAATGRLFKAARSKRYWALSARGRLLCLLVGLGCVAGTVAALLSIFTRSV